ncbi:uncharacterized protein [Littorina saxatilis]|uniref:EB domain-containing protein n=1 Tax=Littorina saxatilis TaxID=31220 RepID=A0AAN9FY59_9CAEN
MAKLIEVSVISLVLLCVAVAEGVQLGGACTVSTNCTTVATNSECTSKTCRCVAGYVAKSDKAKCLVMFNETCTNTAECLPNATCTSNHCMCNMNFQPSDDGMECNVATALTTSFILLIAAMLVSRFFSALGLENVI